VRRLALLATALALAACGGSGSGGAASRELAGLHVVGNRLVDGGRTVVLRGVNRSGTEYACIQGWGIFDGPSDAASVRAIARWHADVVRVPVNEDCWLGTHVERGLGGAAYRRAIERYVALLHRFGLYAEVSLMWAAPGRYPATYQAGGPDADHAPAVWAGMARAFRDDHRVILAPWGETIADSRCFERGGVCEATFGPHNVRYRLAGMQQAVDVMRRAGYSGPIAIPGVSYANDLSHWLRDEPRDPLHQLVAEAHVYGKNTCDAAACFDRTYLPVARRVPLLFGETGETYDASECGTRRIARIVGWADAHGAGWEAWAWDAWKQDCSALIAGYAGRPNPGFGAWIKARLVRAR
jgi:hypothetical protein